MIRSPFLRPGVLLGLTLASAAHAAAPSTRGTEAVEIPKPGPPRPAYSGNELLLSTITGSVFGFGVGHAIERRWLKAGWPFALADGLALGVLLSERRKHSNLRTSATTLFWSSRILQVGELTWFGVRQGLFTSREPASVQPGMRWSVIPSETGVESVVSYRF